MGWHHDVAQPPVATHDTQSGPMTRARVKALHDKVNSLLSVHDLDTPLNCFLPHSDTLCVLRYELHEDLQGSVEHGQASSQEDGGETREEEEERKAETSQPPDQPRLAPRLASAQRLSATRPATAGPTAGQCTEAVSRQTSHGWPHGWPVHRGRQPPDQPRLASRLASAQRPSAARPATAGPGADPRFQHASVSPPFSLLAPFTPGL